MGFYAPMEMNAYGFTQATTGETLTGTGFGPQNCQAGGPHAVGTSGPLFQRYLSGPCMGQLATVGSVTEAASTFDATQSAAEAAGGKAWRVIVDAPDAVSLRVQEFYPPGDVSLANALVYDATAIPQKPGQFVFRTSGVMPDGSGTNRGYVRFVATYADGQTVAAPVAPLAAGSSPVRAGFTVGSPGVYRIAKNFPSGNPLKVGAFKNGAPLAMPGTVLPPGTGNGDDLDLDYEKDLGFFASLSTPAKVGIAAGAGLGLLALVRAFR